MPVLLILILLLTGLPAAAVFYTDWLWFQEVGYEQVFIRTLTARTIVTVATAVVVFAILAANLVVALRRLRPREFVVATAVGPQTVVVEPSTIRPLALAGAGLVSVLIGLFSGSQWEKWLYYIHATPFGRTDPILSRDIGFYVFTLPLLEVVHGLLFLTLVIATAACGAAYFFGNQIAVDPVRGVQATPAAVRHLSLLAAAVLVVLGLGAWLQIPQLLTSSSGMVTGAAYADVHARMPALRLLMVAAFVGAALVAWHAVSGRRLWPLGAAAGLYIAVSIGGTAYAAVIQRFVVAPNEQVRETPYIIHNIHATRHAFGLDTVEARELSGEARLTRDDVERNRATIDNVPLWNDRPLLDTFSQIQEIRTYYDFVNVHNDRYWINGDYRQIMLSARELNSNSLPSRSWINERLTFTHGYGLTLGPVNEVTPEGLPVLFIRDLPPVSTVDLQVTQPAIYFGQLASDHVFVKTKTEEFDYPRGNDNVFTTYEGDGGVQLSNVFRRLLFALRFRSTDVFFSPNLTTESRVLMYRRIAERVERIAPFLRYDPDPYLTISDGRLVWMQDVYLTSTRYPYSTSLAGVNYIRNAVKVTVDAYHGRTVFHLIDPDDPIAMTIGKVFPGLFQPLDTMPEDLRGRLRYPQQIFAIQAHMFTTYPHAEPRDLLQPGGSVGGARLRGGRAGGADAAVLHHHEAAGRERGRVHPDAALHAPAEGQPRRLDGGAQRRRQLRASDGLPVPEGDGDLRPAPDRRAHQPGSGDRAADHALEPAGLGGHPGHAARDSDRGVARLHQAAVPARGRRLDSRAEARHRRLPEPDRDGGDARAGTGAHLPGRAAAAADAAERRGRGHRDDRRSRTVAGGWSHGSARRPGAPALPACAPGPARRQLGALRGGDRTARADPGEDGGEVGACNPSLRRRLSRSAHTSTHGVATSASMRVRSTKTLTRLAPANRGRLDATGPLLPGARAARRRVGGAGRGAPGEPAEHDRAQPADRGRPAARGAGAAAPAARRAAWRGRTRGPPVATSGHRR
jgi:uncharacterized protein